MKKNSHTLEPAAKVHSLRLPAYKPPGMAV